MLEYRTSVERRKKLHVVTSCQLLNIESSSVHGAENPRLGRRIVNLHRGPLIRVALLLLGERTVQRLLSSHSLDAVDARVPAHPPYFVPVEEHLISLLLDLVLLVASFHPTRAKRGAMEREGGQLSAPVARGGHWARVGVFLAFPGVWGHTVGWSGSGLGLTRCSPPSWYRARATCLRPVSTQTHVSLRRSAVTTTGGGNPQIP